MKLPWELFLSLRYLKPKRTFVSIITVISTIGVVLSVTVLIARLMDAGKQLFARLEAKAWHGDWLKIDIGVYLRDF